MKKNKREKGIKKVRPLYKKKKEQVNFTTI